MTLTEITQILLTNRGLTTSDQIDEFFHSRNPKTIPSPFDSTSAIQIIKQHISANSKIIIVGDYDVDGICSTAILWEALYEITKNVFPYIPHRRDDGYGLTIGVIDKLISDGAQLIVAVDCGITSEAAVAAARAKNCDVIIIDHHQTRDSLPDANAILHSTSTSAAGLVWFFCRDLGSKLNHLELVALSVICDIIPLLGINRSFARYGLLELNQTTRPGLKALFQVSGIDPVQKPVGTYEVGFVLGPRLNAMGRLENALDSLRLLCTTDPQKARDLAHLLNETNLARQELTLTAVNHAIASITTLPNLLIVSDTSYDEGIIGLVAAKLVEKFHRPAIAFSINGDTAKGSARSISGFNIIDHLRSFAELFISVGGHSMAAGMAISTRNISKIIQPEISPDLLIKKHRFDLEVPLSVIDLDLYLRLADFAPFGLGNPQPVFQSTGVVISQAKKIGKQLQHLKFKAGDLDAVWFNADPNAYSPMPNALIYSLDLNTWNGRSTLLLIVKHAVSLE